MRALFVELPAFGRHRADYLDDEQFRGLQNALLDNPEAGDVIEGTGGLRKVRHADVRRGGIIDHLWIRVRDLDASVAFYTAIMRYVGLREGRRWEHGRQFRGAWATFSLVADGTPSTEHLRLAFPAPDRRTVEEFHLAATAAGSGHGGEAANKL